MWRLLLIRLGVVGGVLAAGILFLILLLLYPDTTQAHHLCAATGSPSGPFDIQTYEAKDYRTTYARALELAGFNQLFSDLPSFALPRLETGDRTAGSGATTDPYIPPVLLKSIAWLESTWAQADYSVPYGLPGPALISHDCGYGIMQVTSGMQNVTGVPNLDQAMIGGHYAFNIARGARILADKWNQSPELHPLVGNRDPHIIENWYFALWSYNGFAFKNHPFNPDYPAARPQFSCGPADDGFGHDRSQYPYQEMVLGCAAHPPIKDGVPLWNPQEVHPPDLSDPKFAEPLKLDNWNACIYDAQCAAMDIPTPNTNHQDPTSVSVNRTQILGFPAASASTASVSLEAIPGSESLPDPLTISNSGTGILAWHATASQPWLKVSRNQGVSLGTDLGSQGEAVQVYANAEGLAPGTYTGNLAVESLYATGAPITISVTLYVSLQASSPLTADFSGDGESDVVFLCCSDYVSMWLPDGKDGFHVSTYVPWAGYAMETGSWLSGDLNGDHKTDLVHICCTGYINSWVSGGDGTFRIDAFTPWPDYDIQAGTWRAGDFNGDGKTDLIHLGGSDYANVWLSNGDGTFRVLTFQAWPGYDMQAGSWEAGDFNGDGKTDLVHLCCSNYADLWLSNGDGTFRVSSFQPSADYDMKSGSWQAGDVNGDGKTDLIHLCCSNYANTWLSNGDGSFRVSSFQPSADYDMKSGSWLSGDLNGDGKTDLIHLCCSDYANTWLSNGDGSFAVNAFQPWPGYGMRAGSFEAGDFNGDKMTDLLHLCCHYVNVWRSVGGGKFAIDTISP